MAGGWVVMTVAHFSGYCKGRKRCILIYDIIPMVVYHKSYDNMLDCDF